MDAADGLCPPAVQLTSKCAGSAMELQTSLSSKIYYFLPVPHRVQEDSKETAEAVKARETD